MKWVKDDYSPFSKQKADSTPEPGGNLESLGVIADEEGEGLRQVGS